MSAGRFPQRRLVLSILFLVAAMPFVLMGADAAGAMRQGPPAEARDVLPVLMARWHDLPVDLTGDGVPEHMMVGGDGVIQVYTASGGMLWATDIHGILNGTGLPVDSAGLIFGPFRYLAEPSGAGPVFHDMDGDGVPDLIAAMFVALDDPVWRLQSVIMMISGDDGAPLSVWLFEGVVRNVLLDDFDHDGTKELFYIEEDGTSHLNERDTHRIGTNGTVTAHVVTLDRTPVWSRTFTETWAHATAITVGTFDGEGPDLAIALTGGFTKFEALLETRTLRFPQTVYALDGRTGATAWQRALPAEYVREMHLADVDGDLVDDLVLRIQESQGMHATQTRGDDRGRLMALRGLDGGTLWDRVGAFGARPFLHDSLVIPGDEPILMVAYAADARARYGAEQEEHVGLFALTDGADLMDLKLTEGIASDPLLESTIGIGEQPTPTPLSAVPVVSAMRLAMVTSAADGSERVVLGSSRGLVGLELDGTLTEVTWRRPGVHVDTQSLFVLDGDRLWTPDIAGGRMLVYGADGGVLLHELRLLSLTSAVVRTDVDGDGALDRVAATSSKQVVAFDNGSMSIEWRRDLDDYVSDMALADLDSDGKDEIIVFTRLAIQALDARDGSVLWRHVHGDRGQVSAWRLHDMDRDGAPDVVFGTRTSNQGGASSVGGLAQITRLEGSDGSVVWSRTFTPPDWEIGGIDVGDLDGDGWPDVAFVTQTSTEALWYHAGAISGRFGVFLWELERPVRSGENTLDNDGVVIGDADGDGDLDVFVPQQGIQTTINQVDVVLTAHDGRTGLPIWSRTIEPGRLRSTEGIYRGPIGPGGEDALVLVTYHQGAARWGLFVFDLRGQPLYNVTIEPVAFFTDVQMGDVTGDGFHDLVVASPHGVTAVDGAAALAGNVSFVGHVTDWAASKVALADLDDDVALEIEFFSSEGNWPLYLGTRPYTDMDRGKAVGTVDFGLGPKHPGDDDDDDGGGDDGNETAPNARPVAAMRLPSGTLYPGDSASFQSLSSDADGVIAETRWTFSDGVVASGQTVVRSFDAAGTYSVTLTVVDDDGASASASGSVQIAPSELWGVWQSRTSSWASPGEIVRYSLHLSNDGNAMTSFSAAATAPASWSVHVTPDRVTLAPGESVSLAVQAVVGDPLPQGLLRAVVTSGSGQRAALDHPVAVPLVLDAALDDADARYGPTDEVTGTLFLHWRDGVPLADVAVHIQVQGQDGPITVRTDEDGRATFTAPRDDAIWSLGEHTLRIEPQVAGYGTYRVLDFRVTLTG